MMSPINKNFFHSIASSNSSKDLAEKIGETTLDAVLKDGVLKDIPIIGTALSLMKAGDDIKSYLFAKKALTFLSEIDNLPHASREKFLSDNFQTDKQKEKLSDNLLLQIEQAHSIRTCKLLGRIFSAYASDKINERYYQLFCVAAMRMSDYQLEQTHQFYKDELNYGIEFHAMHDLATLGLIDVRVTNQLFKLQEGNKGFFSDEPVKNALGKSFHKHVVAPDYA